MPESVTPEVATQSNPSSEDSTKRDETKRVETLSRLRQAIDRNIDDPAKAQAYRDLLAEVEENFGRDSDHPEAAEVELDEHERVEKLNSEYIDLKMFEYLERMLDAEEAEYKQDYSKYESIAQFKQFFEETDLGKKIKLGGKVVAAGAMVTAGLVGGGMLNPLTYAAVPLLLDAVAEYVQYDKFERDRIQDLRASRADRLGMAINGLFKRNAVKAELTEDGPEDPMQHKQESIRTDQIDLSQPGVVMHEEIGSIQNALTADVTNLEEIDQSILEQRGDLANVRMIGGGIRLVMQAPFLANALINGISLGVQNFDAAHHVVNGAHEVIMNARNGLGFVHNVADASRSLSSLGSAVNFAPMAQAWAGAIGAATTMVGLTTARAIDLFKNGSIQNNPEEIQKYSLRGTTTPGNNDYEFSRNSASVGERSIVDEKSKVAEVKGGMNPGTIWRWEITPPGSGAITQYFRVIKQEPNGDLLYSVVNPDTGEETEPRNRIYSHRDPEAAFARASKVADNIDTYKEKIRAKMETDREVEEVLADEGIRKLDEGQEWIARDEFELHKEDGSVINIARNDKIVIDRFKNAKALVMVTIIGADGVDKAGGRVRTVEILKNSTLSKKTERKERVSYSAMLDEIEDVISERSGARVSISENLVIGVGNTWFKITKIDKDKGTFNVAKHDAPNEQIIKPDVAFKDSASSPINLEKFIEILNEKDGLNLKRIIVLDSSKKGPEKKRSTK